MASSKKNIIIKLFIILIFIVSFYFSKISKAEIKCDSGGVMNGALATETPTYDYGSDGLVRFHIKLSHVNHSGATILYYQHYDADCVYHGFNAFTYSGRVTLPDFDHLLLKAYTNDGIYFGFTGVNEDTGEPFDLGPMPDSFTIADMPVVDVKIFTSDGYPGFPGYTEYGFKTPAVPVRLPITYTYKTPVLIIPGVLGTEIKKDNNILWLDFNTIFKSSSDSFLDNLSFDQDLKPLDNSISIENVIKKIDPLGNFKKFDYTDGLIKEFEGQGYTEGQDLFTFPYDWRFGVSEDITSQLKGQIDYILNQTAAGQANGKVDVVAHSTGGLLVKKYVLENPDHHIGKAVFVGVPNLGAPKAIKVLLTGDNFGVLGLNDEEMRYISQNMPVVYDLSPSEKYYASKGSVIRTVKQTGIFSTEVTDLSSQETHDFLNHNHQLNGQALENAASLHTLDFDNADLRQHGVDVYNIVGCKSGTLGKITETLADASEDPLYEFSNVPGDGTVPLESATNMPVDANHKYFALKGDHGKMPSQDGIRQAVVNSISGSNLDMGSSMTQDVSQCKLKGKAISIYSPLVMEVRDQNGDRSGISDDGSIQNDIPNANYMLAAGRSFAYLPTDDNQEYQMHVTGTGDGEFTLKVGNISDNDITGTEVFIDIPVSSTTKGQILFSENGSSLLLDAEADGVFEQSLQPNFILNSDESQDVVRPATEAKISGSQDANQKYVGGAAVSLGAQDIVVTGIEKQTSGIFRTKYSLDGGKKYSTYSDPLNFDTPGDYTVLFYSIDRAGNKELPKSVNFTVVSQTESHDPPPPTGNPSAVGGSWSGGANAVPLTGKVLGVNTQISPHKPGTLVLDLDGRTIYMVGKGRKFGFRRPEEYLSYGFKFSDAVAANTADHLLPDADIVYAKPGTFVEHDRTYYLISHNKVKHKVAGSALIEAIIKTQNIDISDYEERDLVSESTSSYLAPSIFAADI